MMMSLQELHDELLKNLPESSVHEVEKCSLCNENIEKSNITEGGDIMTYTEEEFTTAVKEAVAPLQAAAEAKVAEIQAKLDALTAEKADEEVAGQIAEVRIELDKAELRATTAEEKYDSLVAYLEAEEAKKVELAQKEARKGEIRKIAKETVGFKDDHIEANLDRWAEMSEEVFAAVVEDWKQIKAEADTASETEEELSEVPAETAMNSTRTETSAPSNARLVLGARNAGVDVRKFY